MQPITNKIDIVLIFMVCLIGGCSKPITSHKVVSPNLEIIPSSENNESYPSIKAKWTVTLQAAKPEKSSSMMLGGPPAMGPGREFPLMITATLMDADVINAGFQYYGNLLSMTSEETDRFRERYFEIHNSEKYVLIEAMLRTFWTEIYLDLSRWTIFLEDDNGNQYEPAKITDQPLEALGLNTGLSAPFYNQRNPFPFNNHQKQIYLYFPRRDSYGELLIHPEVEYLKISFLLQEGGQDRAEGIWKFNWHRE